MGLSDALGVLWALTEDLNFDGPLGSLPTQDILW